MGLFGMFGKTDREKLVCQKVNVQLNNALFNDLTQGIAMLMYEQKITQGPHMRYLMSDGGILRGMFASHATNPETLKLKTLSNSTYLVVCSMHAIGGGMYCIYYQNEVKKPVQDFSDSDCLELIDRWKHTDPYELALKTYGIGIPSGNKRCLDNIGMVAVNHYVQLTGKKKYEDDNLYTLMQVMFNAGVTVGMS